MVKNATVKNSTNQSSVDEKSDSANQPVLIADYRNLNYREEPVQPNYPRMATRRGLEGTVMLVLHINTAGKVERVVIDRSSGYSILDRAAVKAASQWRFVPAIRAGEVAAAQANIPVRFSLVGSK